MVNADVFTPECLLVPALLTFDGSRAKCGWGNNAGVPLGIQAPANGPWAMRTDFVGNSNDSYWLNNPRALLTGPAPYGFSPLYGKTRVEQKLRSRLGFVQLEEMLAAKPKLAVGDVQALMYPNRVHAAELILPEFLPACLAAGDAALTPACQVLAAWDKRADADSRGAVLFREFWNVASTVNAKWAVPLDPADPVHTPRGLAPAAIPAMILALRAATLKMQNYGFALDARFGDVQGRHQGRDAHTLARRHWRSGRRVQLPAHESDGARWLHGCRLRHQLRPDGHLRRRRPHRAGHPGVRSVG